ncbi:unnamed protein product [Spirodela intermedia]|uniref:Uncharacterized protein n=1 Tax=Spirodela intermedia TaxID=51605 RepID=A0ABN7EDN0_SPIIN|nr:unnamed protein product [Spirodela intermedia]
MDKHFLSKSLNFSHENKGRSGGSSCSVHGLEGSPWTKTMWAISRSSRERSMKWVVESSPVAVTRQSGKTATLRHSDGCHPTERSWMERRLFIASGTLSGGGDCSNAPRIALTRFSPMIQRLSLLNPSPTICRKVAIIR